jgi:hypothetical protein
LSQKRESRKKPIDVEQRRLSNSRTWRPERLEGDLGGALLDLDN